MLQKILVEDSAGTNMTMATETAKKIANCINHLITKENVLMVTQDSKVKNERLLCLNIHLDMDSLNLQGK